MTTIVDPAGTPAPVYNNEGRVVMDLPILMGAPGETVMPIPHYAQMTIVNVAVTQTNAPFDEGGAELPTGADVGDVVELYSTDGTNYRITAPAGETLTFFGATTRYPVPVAARLVKVSATAWRFLVP